MGWKGTLRSLSAAARASERHAHRQRKQQLKTQLIASSAAAVEDWEDHLQRLVSLHADPTKKVDWNIIADEPAPSSPIYIGERKRLAEDRLAEFSPSLLHFFRGGSGKVLSKLRKELESATESDQNEHEQAQSAYQSALNEWREETAFARRVLSCDAAAMRQVINEMQSLSDVSLVGQELSFVFGDNCAQATLRVHGDDIIPTIRRKQLASGRLSETKMPAAQFNELYQDYVASAALRVAIESLNLLPLSEVYVTCEANILNAMTGHHEWTPILSVQFVRDVLFRLNLSRIDPSDAMKNFRHNSEFSKARGFSRIKPLVTLD